MTDKLKLVLCVIERDGKFLLPLKERKIGAGRRNGVGGKVEGSESFLEAAYRETHEEAGIDISEIEEMGVLDVTTPDFTAELHIYHVKKFSGEPTEQEGQGMKDFQWYPKDALPFEAMWPNDKIWYPLLIDGKHFSGKLELTSEGNVISHDIHGEETDELKIR